MMRRPPVYPAALIAFALGTLTYVKSAVEIGVMDMYRPSGVEGYMNCLDNRDLVEQAIRSGTKRPEIIRFPLNRLNEEIEALGEDPIVSSYMHRRDFYQLWRKAGLLVGFASFGVAMSARALRED